MQTQRDEFALFVFGGAAGNISIMLVRTIYYSSTDVSTLHFFHLTYSTPVCLRLSAEEILSRHPGMVISFSLSAMFVHVFSTLAS